MCFAPRTTYQPVSARHWKPWRNVPCPLCGPSAACHAPRQTSSTPEGIWESHSHSKTLKNPKSRRKPPATIDCCSLLTVTSRPRDHFMEILFCAFQVQLWVITKQNPLSHWPENVLHKRRGTVTLVIPWWAGEIPRRIRHLLGLAPRKGAKLGKSMKWCLPHTQRKKRRDQVFPRLPQDYQETKPHLFRKQRTLLINLGRIILSLSATLLRAAAI